MQPPLLGSPFFLIPPALGFPRAGLVPDILLVAVAGPSYFLGSLGWAGGFRENLPLVVCMAVPPSS